MDGSKRSSDVQGLHPAQARNRGGSPASALNGKPQPTVHNSLVIESTAFGTQSHINQVEVDRPWSSGSVTTPHVHTYQTLNKYHIFSFLIDNGK